MPQQVQGVVARSKGAPVELAEINIPDPGSPALRSCSPVPSCPTQQLSRPVQDCEGWPAVTHVLRCPLGRHREFVAS